MQRFRYRILLDQQQLPHLVRKVRIPTPFSLNISSVLTTEARHCSPKDNIPSEAVPVTPPAPSQPIEPLPLQVSTPMPPFEKGNLNAFFIKLCEKGQEAYKQRQAAIIALNWFLNFGLVLRSRRCRPGYSSRNRGLSITAAMVSMIRYSFSADVSNIFCISQRSWGSSPLA